MLARLRLDCPELFYVTGFSYRVHPAAATVELLPQYLFDKGKIQTHQKALAARLDRLCRPAMGLNEGEKERYVHDFICRNVRYDKLKKPYSHEILGRWARGWGCARVSPRRSSACATGWGCGASWPWRRTTRTRGQVPPRLERGAPGGCVLPPGRHL